MRELSQGVKIFKWHRTKKNKNIPTKKMRSGSAHNLSHSYDNLDAFIHITLSHLNNVIPKEIYFAFNNFLLNNLQNEANFHTLMTIQLFYIISYCLKSTKNCSFMMMTKTLTTLLKLLLHRYFQTCKIHLNHIPQFQISLT